MSTYLDELYLSWLYKQVRERNASQEHWNLAKALYTKPFEWFVPNDDNRIADGLYLRDEFDSEQEDPIEDHDWLSYQCSVLELLIGLARRLSFLEGGEPRVWFWDMIDNLGIRYDDQRRFPKKKVEEVLEALIFRNYEYNGRGGLFPLRNPEEDQRDIELWQQLNAYTLELD